MDAVGSQGAYIGDSRISVSLSADVAIVDRISDRMTSKARDFVYNCDICR